MNKHRTYTIRVALHADAKALADLATLDSKAPLTGDVLLAEFEEGIAAAVAMDTGLVIADPFLPTAGLVEALRVTRANHERAGIRPRRRDRSVATLLRSVRVAAAAR
jgi:hypothetical protein